MNNNLILLFNDFYQLYLNGIDSEYIIKSYISKNLLLLDKNGYIKNYKIVDKIQINDINIIKLEFANKLIGYLYFEFIDDNINLNNCNIDFNLFITYLSLLLHNCKYIERPTLINCCIFNNILDNIQDGIIITDNNFNMLFINSNFKVILELLNYKDLSNINLFTIFPILNSQLDKCNLFKNRRIHYDLNIDSNKLYLKLIINTIINNDINYNLIIITNRKKDSYSNNNISILSHELRNPLQSINLATYILQYKDIPDDITKYVTIINKSVYDMKKIINDVYDISKINSNDIILNIENINIKEIIDDIIFDFNQYIINDSITFTYKINETVPSFLFTDSTRLKQIIINLLSNSIKYSKINNKNIINFIVDYEDTNVKFIIEDTGIGIKDDEIKNLFKYKSVTTNNNIIKCDSNGFGLYICNKLAHLLGGKIEIKSKYMIGTTFILIHPLKLGNNDIIFKKNIEELRFNGNILIVDDNEINAYLFKNIIDNLKFSDRINSTLNIDICLSGEIAIDLCKLKDYNLIFMDINMKGIDGIITSKILRKNNYTGKIIAATGNHEFIIDKTIFNDFIIKPFDDNNIIDLFQKYL